MNDPSAQYYDGYELLTAAFMLKGVTACLACRCAQLSPQQTTVYHMSENQNQTLKN